VFIEYFWNKCLQQGNPRGLKPEDFTYPGMKPQTKETAILMLVDSIEAASRTVEKPSRAQFSQVIQRIVFTKLEQGQLDECGLDLAELRTITTRMTDTLVNMYHHRIKYQWQVQRAEEFGVPSRAIRGSAPDIEVGSALMTIPPVASASAEPRLAQDSTVSRIVETRRTPAIAAPGPAAGDDARLTPPPAGEAGRTELPRVGPRADGEAASSSPRAERCPDGP